MDERGWDIDRIVQEVLRRLREPVSPAGEAPPPVPDPREAQASEPGTLRLPERLVTLAVIEGRLAGVRHVVVRPEAIVTPAVQDLLRKRGIGVTRDESQPAAPSAGTPCALAASETQFDPAALAVQVGGELVQAGTLVKAIEALAERIRRRNQLAVLLTGQIAPATCLANRQPGVRAAWGGSLPMIRDAVQSVGANLLVLDPAERSLTELAKSVREFLRPGPRECPLAYRDLL